MRTTVQLLLLVCTSFCLAQTDSMIVQKIDGSLLSFPVSLINQITFSGMPTGVREQRMMQDVLKSFTLFQNYPNPFNPRTTVDYSLPSAGHVQVSVFDLEGRLVRTLINSYQQQGRHSVIWDSRSDGGDPVASGTYFCRVLFTGSVIVKKLVLVK